MNSMESILNVMDKKYSKSNESYSDNSYNSKLSVESFISRDVAEKNPDLVRDLKKIINDKSTSMEHYKFQYNNLYNDSVMMSNIWNRSVQQRFKKVRFIKNLINANTDKSREAANDMIHMMSIESEDKWYKTAWEGVKATIKKIISAIASFVRRLINYFRSKMALGDCKFYTDNAGKLSEALKNNGSKKIKYKMYKKITVDGIGGKVEEMRTKSRTLQSSASVWGDSDKSATMNSALYDGNEANTNGIGKVVDEYFFGSSEKKTAEHPISDLLDANTFKCLSKEYLNKLNGLDSAAKELSKACNEVLKGIDKVSKEDKSDGHKERRKETTKKISKIKTKIHYHQAYISQFFWVALSYRSTIKKLAKSAFGEKENKKEDKK